MFAGKYDDWCSAEGLAVVAKWDREGLSEEQIAANMGICRKTLRRWKRKNPRLAEALRSFGTDTDRLVEDALLKKASGYTVDVVKTYKLKRIEYQDGKKTCELEELAQGIDQVHVPADLSAQIFWLKNKMPDKWQDKPDAGRLSLLKLDEVLGDFRNEVEQKTN